jgi:hypothetical protein
MIRQLFVIPYSYHLCMHVSEMMTKGLKFNKLKTDLVAILKMKHTINEYEKCSDKHCEIMGPYSWK